MTLYTILYGFLLLLNSVATFLLVLYSINCYIMVFLHHRAKTRRLQDDEIVWKAWQAGAPPLPRVTVQLPIYNERCVIQRLIDAVVRLHYPKDLLEIQVLDDSTDETTAIASQLVEHYRQEGFDITLLHRQYRYGYKAGALKEGLTVAKGSFIAIFDADFVPEPDFLLRTLPFFQDPTVAMIQVRWGHINEEYSLLTRAQAFGLNGHFWVEQAARCWSGLFMNFNGSGGIWRRQAIDEAGGWQIDTLTEDLDLSYRAQLEGWRLKFLPQVVCPAEIPVQMFAMKSQQHRWAKGFIQTAKKLIPRILRAPLPLFTKYQAICHLTNYLAHPLILLVSLLSPLFFWFNTNFSVKQQHFLGAVWFLLVIFGHSSLYVYACRQIYQDWKRRLYAFPFLFIFGTGIALNNTKAVLEAIFNIHSTFVRTPKFRIEHSSDTWVGKLYCVPFPWLSLGEATLALYYGYGLFLSIRQDTYLTNPFLLLFTFSFGYVAFLSFWEFWQESTTGRHQQRSPRERETSHPI